MQLKNRVRKLGDWMIDRALSFANFQQTLALQINITDQCNLRCKHCYHPARRDGFVLTVEQWQAIIIKYRSLITTLHLAPDLIICGGEPFFRQDLRDILAAVRIVLPSAPISLLSNGTMLTPEICDWLTPLNPFIQISIDGPDAARHDAVRGTGVFAKAQASIDLLRRCGITFSMQAILSRRSAPWIDEFFALAKALGASLMSFSRLILEGQAKNLVASHLDDVLSPGELRDAYTTILAASRETSVPTNTRLPLYCLIDPALGGHGQLGFQGIIVDHDGAMRPTSRTDYSIGNVLTQDMEDLFLNHPLMKRFRDKNNFQVCGDCEHWPQCGGSRNAAFAQFGDYFAPDPGCWLAFPPSTKPLMTR